MAIKIACVCGQRLVVTDHLAGRVALCPKCGARLKIPEAEQPELPTQPEQPHQPKPQPGEPTTKHSVQGPVSRTERRPAARGSKVRGLIRSAGWLIGFGLVVGLLTVFWVAAAEGAGRSPTGAGVVEAFLLIALFVLGGLWVLGRLGLLLTAVLTRLAMKLIKLEEKLYDAFAEHVNGEVVRSGRGLRSTQAVTFSCCGVPVQLDQEKRPNLAGGSIVYTRLTFFLPEATSFRCEVHSRTLAFAKFFRTQWEPVQLGWETFDSQFLVRVTDRIRAAEVLNHQVQEELLRLKQWRGQGQLVVPGSGLIIDGPSLQVCTATLLNELEQLITFYEFSLRLYDKLQKALSA